MLVIDVAPPASDVVREWLSPVSAVVERAKPVRARVGLAGLLPSWTAVRRAADQARTASRWAPTEKRAVLRALIREGTRMLTVPDLIREIVTRIGCSRRTAYRVLRRACTEGVITIPGY